MKYCRYAIKPKKDSWGMVKCINKIKDFKYTSVIYCNSCKEKSPEPNQKLPGKITNFFKIKVNENANRT